MVAQVPELCVYPGEVNPRVRWDGMTPATGREERSRQGPVIRSQRVRDARQRGEDASQEPSRREEPRLRLNFQQIGQIENQYVVEDAKGERLVLTDHGMSEEPKTCHLLGLLPPELFSKQTLVARFPTRLDTRKLRIKPLAIVTETQVVRLTF